jgi:hypothetical protein
MAMRVLAGLLGAFYFVQGIGWIANPSGAAESLGMPLLDGLGRSTQVGDFASFFLALGTMGLIGAYQRSATWLCAGALLVGLSSVTRTLAWLVHDADFAGVFISVEVVSAALLLFVASRFTEKVGDAVA